MSMIEMRGITKRFGALTALDHVDFSLEKGEIDSEGRIDSLTYSEPKNVTKQTESLLGRLFK